MEDALDSLLRQDYPSLAVLLVTHGRKDPARQLALKLAARYACARHVEAGPARHCGQKNRNLLDALKKAAPETAVYAFCDANHLARPDFIRRLTEPVIRGREKFCAGYRRTRLLSTDPCAVAGHILVWHLGLLQSLSFFTQPWGGAFAADAAAFRELGVADLWRRSVVDDVSLAGLLLAKRIRVRYCPGAILDSPLRDMPAARLHEWLFRQLFYPKVYTFRLWAALGAFLAWCALTGAAGAALIAALTIGAPVPAGAGLLALAHLGLPFILQERLRRRAAPDCAPVRWRQGLRLALRALILAFCRAARARGLVWHGIRYELSADGRVSSVEHPADAEEDEQL
jgi:hypothetical protein